MDKEEELVIDDLEDEFTKTMREANIQRMQDRIKEKMREKLLQDLKRAQAARDFKVQQNIKEIRAVRAKINPIIAGEDITKGDAGSV